MSDVCYYLCCVDLTRHDSVGWELNRSLNCHLCRFCVAGCLGVYRMEVAEYTELSYMYASNMDSIVTSFAGFMKSEDCVLLNSIP